MNSYEYLEHVKLMAYSIKLGKLDAFTASEIIANYHDVSLEKAIDDILNKNKVNIGE